MYGRDCLLPVEFELASWSLVDWEAIESREDLILARMRQLDQRSLVEAHAAQELEYSRKGNKAYFDEHKRLRNSPLNVGDLVLLHRTMTSKAIERTVFKLSDKWRGPYRIAEVGKSGYYRLRELDGVELAESVAGNRLKKFFS